MKTRTKIKITLVLMAVSFGAGIALSPNADPVIQEKIVYRNAPPVPMYPPIKVKSFVGMPEQLAVNIPASAVNLSRNFMKNKWSK